MFSVHNSVQKNLGNSCKLKNFFPNTSVDFHDVQELHSSRMHTSPLLTVSPSMHSTGGGLLARGSALPGGLLAGGVCLARGGLLAWGLLPGGVWYPSMH